MLIPDQMDLPDEHWSKLYYSVNASLKNRFGVHHYPLVKCLPTNSKICLELQLADVLLGSVVAGYNDNFKSQHKQQLSDRLFSAIAACDRTKASIWEWKPTEND